MKNFKKLFENPLVGKNAHFEYEVIEMSEVENINLTFEGCSYHEPKRMVLLKTLSFSSSNYFWCTLYYNDALKSIREGELISAKLRFDVKKTENGYEQCIIASDILTLHDYYQILEANAHLEGKTEGKRQETA